MINETIHQKLMKGKSANPLMPSTVFTYSANFWRIIEKIERIKKIFKKK